MPLPRVASFSLAPRVICRVNLLRAASARKHGVGLLKTYAQSSLPGLVDSVTLWERAPLLMGARRGCCPADQRLLAQGGRPLLHRKLLFRPEMTRFSPEVLHFGSGVLLFCAGMLCFMREMLSFGDKRSSFVNEMLYFVVEIKHFTGERSSFTRVILHFAHVMLDYGRVMLHSGHVMLHSGLVMLHYGRVMLHYGHGMLHSAGEMKHSAGEIKHSVREQLLLGDERLHPGAVLRLTWCGAFLPWGVGRLTR